MKRILLFIAVVMTALLSGCNKPENQQSQQETIEVSLEVTGIADNCATINVSLTAGNFYGARIIEMIDLQDVTIDLESEIQLTNYVIENGVDIELPYSNTLTDIRLGQKKFTAVIVYDSTGRAVDVQYVTWDPVGLPDGWSTDNNPGELEEIEW